MLDFDAYLSRCEDAAMREPDGECPVCGHLANLDEGVRWCQECQQDKINRRRDRITNWRRWHATRSRTMRGRRTSCTH